MIGDDRESHQRDLLDSIDNQDFPKWTLKVQVMPEADAATVPYNPFDLTKIWPHADYPLIEVGEFELNRNPQNFFAEVEQSAFNPANVVPGISNLKKVLLGFVYVILGLALFLLGLEILLALGLAQYGGE